MFGRDTNTTGVVNVSLSPGEVVVFFFNMYVFFNLVILSKFSY